MSYLSLSQTLTQRRAKTVTMIQPITENQHYIRVVDDALHQEWVQLQAAAQNPALFRPIYDRYYVQLFKFVFARVSDEDTTADLCSQIFLKALQGLKTYQFKSIPYSAYLYRIAANEITSYHRVNQKARTVSIEESSIAALFEEHLEENQWDKYKPKLTEVLNELRETDLQLIEMRFFEQLSFKEIAEIVGLTESNTKVKTYRVLERIKQKLVT